MRLKIKVLGSLSYAFSILGIIISLVHARTIINKYKSKAEPESKCDKYEVPKHLMRLKIKVLGSLSCTFKQ